MQIAIPSYNRVSTLKTKTMALLMKEKVPPNLITIFVADETEKDKYQEVFSDVRIVVGEKGIVEIRNFITNYYDEGETYLSMDDDISQFVYPIGSSLLMEIDKMEEKLKSSEAHLLGVNPTGNKFFMRGEWKEGLYFCVGCFFMIKNRKEIIVQNQLDDYERTMECFIRDNKVIRYDQFSFKTKYYAEGGISTERNLETYTYMVNDLHQRYNRFLALTQKKNKKNLKIFGQESIPHLRFREKKQAVFCSADYSIDVLPPLEEEVTDKLFAILKKTKFRTRSMPARFKGQEALTFGWIRGMLSNEYDWGINNDKFPELWELLKEIGAAIVPHEWNAVQVTHNAVCSKHVDSKNSGKSTIFSIGEYVGCNLVINGVEYDARQTPLSFNGGMLLHWNTPFLIPGDKFSVVFY